MKKNNCMLIEKGKVIQTGSFKELSEEQLGIKLKIISSSDEEIAQLEEKYNNLIEKLDNKKALRFEHLLMVMTVPKLALTKISLFDKLFKRVRHWVIIRNDEVVLRTFGTYKEAIKKCGTGEKLYPYLGIISYGAWDKEFI